MSRLDYKIQDALVPHLSYGPPRETLKAFVMGVEALNPWLSFLVLGYAAAAGMKSYYMALTETRIVLLALSWWTNKPTRDVSEISLGRISGLRLKRGILGKQLVIHYGEDIKRVFSVPWTQSQNAEHFVDTYVQSPKPSLTVAEQWRVGLEENAHKEDRKNRIERAVVAFILLLLLMLFCNLVSNCAQGM